MQQHTLRVRDSVCAHYPRSAPRVSTWLVALLPTAYGTNQLLGGWLSVADTVQLERMEWVELASGKVHRAPDHLATTWIASILRIITQLYSNTYMLAGGLLLTHR